MGSRFKPLAVALLLLLPTAVHAQVAWDAPYLVPPGAREDLGIYLMDVHGGGLGAMATWRLPSWNFGLRAGVAQDTNDNVGLFAGIDYAGVVNRSTDEFPLDIDWIFGGGIGVGDGARVSVPVGLTFGHVFAAEGATFTPYLTPRVFFDASFGRDSLENRTGLGFAMDAGLDLKLSQGSSAALSGVVIRFGASVGDRHGVALGVVF